MVVILNPSPTFSSLTLALVLGVEQSRQELTRGVAMGQWGGGLVEHCSKIKAALDR